MSVVGANRAIGPSRLSNPGRLHMAVDIKLAFDILAFTSVMVLIVLGLGVIASMMGIFNFAHGEFVLLGAYTVYLFESNGPVRLGRHPRRADRARAGRPAARALHHPPLLCRADHRHARHLRHRPDHPRDRARPARRPLQVDQRAAARRLHLVRHRLLDLAHRHRRHHDRGDRRHLGVPRPHLDRPADPRLAREPDAVARERHLDHPALCHDLRLRLGARRPRRRADRAALPALRRHRHALPGPGLPVGHAGRRRHLRRAGARRARWSAPPPPACPGSSFPCWPTRWCSCWRC